MAIAPIKRNVAPPATTAGGPSFGDLGFYVQGGGLPEGDYALKFIVQMHDGFGQKKSTPRLGVMVDCHSLTDPKADIRKQFYSMGSGADKSWAPNPDTGTSLVPIPGGPGAGLVNSTNWAYFLKSLYDAGMPKGIFTNDVSVLDGIRVHMQNIPEPEERKGFQSQTGEASEDRKAGVIAVVSEIKDDGKPWEGTGGVPAAGAAAPAPKPTAGKPVAMPKLAAAPAPPTGDLTEEDVVNAALNATAEVLSIETNAGGMSKIALRAAAKTQISTTLGPDMAEAANEIILKDDAQLANILGQHGYKIVGPMIKPQ